MFLTTYDYIDGCKFIFPGIVNSHFSMHIMLYVFFTLAVNFCDIE